MEILIKTTVFMALVSGAHCHDRYLGKCPEFKPVENFEWDKFAGRWYAVEKFDASSRCLTYDFNENELGDREVVQTSESSHLKKLTLNNKVKYTGQLSFPKSSNQADMIVKFPLSVLGSAEYVLMDTDYEKYAMICTCQSSSFIFDILTWHRRSCTILQRDPQRNVAYTNKMQDLLNRQVSPDEDEDASHDFDIIRHDRCNYNDDGKGLEIDVDKILESTKGEIEHTFKATVKEIEDVFQTDKEEASDDEPDDLLILQKEPLSSNQPKKTNFPRV